MKKPVIIILGIFAFFVLSLIALPLLFKGKIVERVDRELTKSINAKVYYDTERISVSLFRSFPHLSLGLGGFGIHGNFPFEGDTLLHVEELRADMNLFSVLFNDTPSLEGVHLEGGSLLVRVLDDGQANYDILFPTEEKESSDLKVEVKAISVEGFDLIYADESLDFFMELEEIKAAGSGDFTLDVYDLPLKAEARIVDMVYGGLHFLGNKKFTAETVVNIDLEKMKFTFDKGDYALNDFQFDFYGAIEMPEEDILFDLGFAGKDNSFKSILSLVPGMYSENFSKINTSGSMTFRGGMKGVYNEYSFPSFEVYLQVLDGMFQFPELPKPVTDINLEMTVSNPTDQLDKTQVYVSNFHMNVGSNPISGTLLITDLNKISIDTEINGRLDLEELTSIFPIAGTELRGILDMRVLAKGSYDSVAKTIPVLDIDFGLRNGYFKNKDYPSALEKIGLRAEMKNPSGKMNDFVLDVPQFGFELEKKTISGNLRITDFDRLQWVAAVKGAVDLGKLLSIMPVTDLNMEGKIQADLNSRGSYEDLSKERYDRLDTKGEILLTSFSLSSPELPQAVQIQKAQADFNSDKIQLNSFDGKLGESSVKASGYLSNYMNYLFKDTGVLRGQLMLSSPRFNVNEWMQSEEPSAPLTVIELPRNIDFTANVEAKEVLYDNLNLKEVEGSLQLKDGIMSFRNASMAALGGNIVINGSYDPRDLAKPKFDLALGLNNLSIAQAYQSLNTVKAFAPVAEHLTGSFNSNLSFSGILGQDMMPILSSLDALGILRVAEAAYRDSRLLQGITSLTKLKDGNTIQFKNVSVPIEIHQGLLTVKPFDLKLWDYQANIRGNTGFDGTINYLIQMQVPAGKFGATANNLLATISGTEASTSTLIPVAINLSGNYKEPKLALAGGASIESLLAAALQSRVSSEKQQLQTKAAEQFQAIEDSLKREINLKAETFQDSLRKVSEKKATEVKEKAVEGAKNVIRGILTRPKQTKPDTIKPDTTKSQ